MEGVQLRRGRLEQHRDVEAGIFVQVLNQELEAISIASHHVRILHA